jgi:hypothetical protein
MNPSWAETQELLTATFEQPEGDREQFVREQCVDPGLRDSIAALVRPSAALDAPAIAAEDQPDLPAGSQVGPYVILHRLGRGGMGEVFLGRDPRLDRSVALKCLLTSHGGSEDLRARVIREARAAARITHANVAAVYDVVEHEGRAFIVMEYVEGESLAVLLRREPLPPERVVAIGRQIAAALAAAHGGGIMHLDLKPANIQVTSNGSIKILDFGIAKALASLTTTRTRSTGVAELRGVQAGTPAYMSPEQLLGRPVDERSDLFSLAVILFEMTTGRRLFPTNDPLAVLVTAVRKLPRADSRDSSVPPELADLIAKGLAADPADRFQSAAEMAGALDAVWEELHSTASRRDNARAAASPPPANRVARAFLVAGLTPIVVWLPIIVWTLGYVSSAAFNNTVGLTGAFAAEPLLQPMVWGIKSLVAPSFYGGLTIVTIWATGYIGRLLTLVPWVARVRERLRAPWRRVVAKLSLDDPLVFPQGLATLGSVAIAMVAWRFFDLIQAWSTMIDTGPGERLWRLGPSNLEEKVLYRAILTVLFLALSAGLVHVLRLRMRRGTRGQTGGLAALVLVVVAVLLMIEAPYRILWKSSAPRGDYNGARCYLLGTHDTKSLLFCPDLPPPRNRTVHAEDPAFHLSGVVENMFTVGGADRVP